VHARSGGIPRTVSVICDNALVSGFAVGERPVTARLIREVCDDFDLRAHESEDPSERSGPPGESHAPETVPEEDAGQAREMFTMHSRSKAKARRFVFF
jgi:hypothetical protein